MKRIIFMLICLLAMCSSYAQIITSQELENIKLQEYGKTKWQKIAQSIVPELNIDKDHYVVYSRVVNVEDKKKDYFNLLKLFVAERFSTPNCEIKVIDKDMGIIIVQGYIENVVKKGEFAISDDLTLKPIIRLDFKSGKIRITCSNIYYYVHEIEYSTFLTESHNNKQVNIYQSYPLMKEGYNNYVASKAAVCKALVMQHIASQKILDYFENLIKEGTYTVDNDW